MDPIGCARHRQVRVLAAAGFVLFAYLVLIPAGLVVTTVDPSCEGCGDSAPVAVVLTVIYGACFLALAACAATLAGYAIRPSGAAARRIATALAASAAAIGVALFALLAVSFPIAGAVIAAIGILLYTWLRRRPGPADPRTNGHRGVRG
jgi:hypothetical protein